MDWGQWIQGVGSQYVTAQLAPAPAPATPVSTGQGGVAYVEGKPTGAASNMSMVYIIGGVAVVGLIAFLALKK